MFADILFTYLPTFQKAVQRPAQPRPAQPRWSSVSSDSIRIPAFIPPSIPETRRHDLSPPLTSGESHSESGAIPIALTGSRHSTFVGAS